MFKRHIYHYIEARRHVTAHSDLSVEVKDFEQIEGSEKNLNRDGIIDTFGNFLPEVFEKIVRKSQNEARNSNSV